MSIVIGALATAVKVSLSDNRGDNKKKKSKKHNHGKKRINRYVEWKGVNSMTLVFAAFLVSIGIPGRDSMMCCWCKNTNVLNIGRSTFGFDSQHAHYNALWI